MSTKKIEDAKTEEVKTLDPEKSYDISEEVAGKIELYNLKVENHRLKLNELQKQADELSKNLQKDEQEFSSILNGFSQDEFGVDFARLNETHVVNIEKRQVLPKNRR